MSMTKNSSARTINLTVVLSNGSKQSIRSSKLARIYSFLQRVNELEIKLFKLRVIYFPISSAIGKRVTPLNEGEYKNMENLKLALKAFLEV